MSPKYSSFKYVVFSTSLSLFLSLSLSHQTLNCLSVRYIVPTKISPALPLCQRTDGKVRFDDFCPLLRSKLSSWIHIGVKIISQACCLHHLKNMEKICKRQLWDEKQNRAFFLGPPCIYNEMWVVEEWVEIFCNFLFHYITDRLYVLSSLFSYICQIH